MGAILPHSEERKTPLSGFGGRKSWIWVSLSAAVLLCFILFIQHQMESNARKKARQTQVSPVSVSEDASPMVRFTREDIKSENHWTLLAGRHPVVTFQCSLDVAAPTCKRAVVCYRTLGEQVWCTVETRLNRDRVARITLRDLYRDMPYESFFVLIGRDTMFQSEVVRFET